MEHTIVRRIAKAGEVHEEYIKELRMHMVSIIAASSYILLIPCVMLGGKRERK